MIFIFTMSAKEADESSQMSLEVGRMVGSILYEDFKVMTAEEQDKFAFSIEFGVRKTAHMMEYALLGLLLAAAIGKERAKYALLIGVLYAGSDEFHQLFVAGRSGKITDVMIDSAGVFLGVLFYLILNKIFLYKKGLSSS